MALIKFSLEQVYSSHPQFSAFEKDLELKIQKINEMGVNYSLLREVCAICLQWLHVAGFEKLSRPKLSLPTVSAAHRPAAPPSKTPNLASAAQEKKVPPVNSKSILIMYYEAENLMNWPEFSQTPAQARWGNLKRTYNIRAGSKPMQAGYFREVITPIETTLSDLILSRMQVCLSTMTIPSIQKLPKTSVFSRTPSELFSDEPISRQLLRFNPNGQFIFHYATSAIPLSIRALTPPKIPDPSKCYMFVFRHYPIQGIYCYDISQMGLVHHSSLAQGGSVSSAGHVEFFDGHISSLANTSGHYRPFPEDFYGILSYLHKNGQDISKIKCYFSILSLSKIFSLDFFSHQHHIPPNPIFEAGHYYTAMGDHVLRHIIESKQRDPEWIKKVPKPFQ